MYFHLQVRDWNFKLVVHVPLHTTTGLVTQKWDKIYKLKPVRIHSIGDLYVKMMSYCSSENGYKAKYVYPKKST